MSTKPIGVAEFKARLSEYLRAVKTGNSLIIADRSQPVARVVPYTETSGRLVVRERVHAYRTFGDIPLPAPIELDVDAVELLIEERERDR
ncbi:MAG: type II toxin-antitoxin system Phd/YefM family antitoxin [Gemmatimonadaceae bacterium]